MSGHGALGSSRSWQRQRPVAGAGDQRAGATFAWRHRDRRDDIADPAV